MRKFVCCFALAAMSAAVLGAAPKDKNKDDAVVIGGVFNLKGEQAVLDVPTWRGALLATEEINKYVGLLDRPLRLEVEDGKSRPDMLAKAVRKIFRKNPGVAAFLGLSDTDMVVAAAQAAPDDRAFLSSGATSPQLPGQFPGRLFLACFGDNVQAAAAAEFAYHQLGARTVSVLYDSSDTYTNLLNKYFSERFVELGGMILSSEAYSPGALEGPVSRLKPAEFVYLAAHVPSDAIEAIGLLRAAGFAVPIVGGDGYDDEQAWEGQTSVEDVYFTTHVFLSEGVTDPQIIKFKADYTARFPGEEPTAFAALGYDAVKLTAEAVLEADSDDPSEVLAALAQISGFDGVTGTISYENGSRIPTKTVSIIEIDHGAYKLAAEWIPDSVPAP